jgi:hypothetical protein
VATAAKLNNMERMSIADGVRSRIVFDWIIICIFLASLSLSLPLSLSTNIILSSNDYQEHQDHLFAPIAAPI